MHLKDNFTSNHRYLLALSTQAEYHGALLVPRWEPSNWLLVTRPVALSPGQFSEAGVQIALAPGMSDGNFGDEFGAFAIDQTHANVSRPGRVSGRLGEKNRILANIDGDSISRIKMILSKEPTHHSIRETGITSSSVAPTCFALHPTVKHHHCSWNTRRALTHSNTTWARESKFQRLANSRSLKWKLLRIPRRIPRDGPAITTVATKAIDDARKLDVIEEISMMSHPSVSSVVSSGPGQRR